MVGARSWSCASLLVCMVLLTACGGSGSAAPGEPALDPGHRTRSAAPATAPEGPTAREVSYRCASGRSATVVVDVPDLTDLADVLNRIDPCEYDGGFQSGTVTLPCGSGPLVVQLAGREGRAVQPSPASLCQ